MLLLGLLLLGAAGAFIGLLIADNLSGGPDYGVTVLGNHIATLNSLGVFLAGIALTLIFGLGCAMVRSAGARARRRRAGARRGRTPPAEVAAERGGMADDVDESAATTTRFGRRHHAAAHRGRLRRRPL